MCITFGENVRAERVVMDNSVKFLRKFKREHDRKNLSVLLLGYISKGTVRMLSKDHTPMFVKALVTTLRPNHLNAYASH